MDPAFFGSSKYENLMEYTNSFSAENLIGDFKFGKIYRGNIERGYEIIQPVTVKIWDTSSDVICDNELRLMLVADDFNWLRRIKVGLWFARIVEFFHSRSPPFEPFVIHNINANHILLDEDYIPKLFDFGLMTGGGIFPEEPQDEKTCGRDDVFGFGLLLLSLISKRIISEEDAVKSIKSEGCYWKSGSSVIGNKKPKLQHTSTTEIHSKKSEAPALPEQKASLSPIHGSLEADPYFDACDGSQVVELVLDCLKSVPDQRPSMKQVVQRLEKLQIAQNHADLLEFKPKPSRYWF
ncbi:hypothetical protein BUALT_Bualt11G0071900 [Buddleja alternifolia]|uniref:Protein kinase domain-containing protein n=1 Tax=Buddleja alternifolia TaxID=168488 RepID=A0AAV6WS68_9LAMI|nr:hypothetical protein BUALT_Bualt11G0071900 [Buddleja alternifolia]